MGSSDDVLKVVKLADKSRKDWRDKSEQEF